MILDRQQFADHMESSMPGMGDRQSPLWIPDQHFATRFEWFLRFEMTPRQTDEFWTFAHNCLSGKIGCFSSGMSTHTSEFWEWWGFTHKDDIPVFVLRWS